MFSSKENCKNLVANALQWVVDNLDEFHPFKSDRSFEIRHGQKITELATMLYSYIKLTGDTHSDGVQKILELLKQVQSDRRFSDRLLRSPAEFILYCDIYTVLRLLGYDNLEQRELLQKLINIGFLDSLERVPHRMMDVRLTLENADLQHSWPSLEEMYKTSILSAIPCALHLEESAIYALTHVIFFLYGFGTRKNVSIPCKDLVGLRHTLSMLLAIACQEHHWDLLGELLLCWDCIELEPNLVYEEAWKTFLEQQQTNGAIPGPEKALIINDRDRQYDLQKLPIEKVDLTITEERELYFAHHYHTTMIGIIAGCVRLNRLNPQSSTGTIDKYIDESAKNFITVVSKDSTSEISDSKVHFERARYWLEKLLETVRGDIGIEPATFCRILLGYWICDNILSTPNSKFGDISQQVYQELMVRDRDNHKNFSDIPALLELIATILLFSQNLCVPSLQNFFCQVAKVVQKKLTHSARISLYEKQLLFDVLGFPSLPSNPIHFSSVFESIRSFSLASDPNCVKQFLLQLNALTRYGTQPIASQACSPDFQEMLAGLATHFLRQYDFLMGGQVLRTMSYLGANDRSDFKDCVDFLKLHQRSDGSFGFFGLEEAELKSKGKSNLAIETELYLPISVSCLWTLGETSSGWRFYQAIQQPIGVER